jgi:hypothetical protein
VFGHYSSAQALAFEISICRQHVANVEVNDHLLNGAVLPVHEVGDWSFHNRLAMGDRPNDKTVLEAVSSLTG